MKYVAVLPWIYEPYYKDCIATMHPDFKANTLIIDNSQVNRGIMWSHNQGLKKMQEENADWLIILSAAIRFGKEGGLDFVKVLEDHPDHYVIHAASDNVVGGKQNDGSPGGGINKVKGWHCTAFSRDCLERVGGWDLNFTPYSLCDIDMSIRIQKEYKGVPGWNTYPCDIDDTGLMGHSINLAKVEASYPPRNEYFKAKWGRDGGEWQVEAYDHPFNEPDKPISWYPIWPDPRAYNHGYWDLLK